MVPLGVSFSLLIENQGLVEVDLSAILGPFDSNGFILCPRVMSFFLKLCPAPLSLLFHYHEVNTGAQDSTPRLGADGGL